MNTTTTALKSDVYVIPFGGQTVISRDFHKQARPIPGSGIESRGEQIAIMVPAGARLLREATYVGTVANWMEAKDLLRA